MPMQARKIISIMAVVFVCSCYSATVADEPVQQSRDDRIVRIGAVAYAPSAVTIFHGLTGYLNKHDFYCDYVLYSNYDALVAALEKGEVDIAWNTPLAHGQYHVRNQCSSQALVMRDVDFDVHSALVVRADSGIKSLADLNGKRLILGSSQAAEATVLPLHFLKAENVELGKMTTVSLDREVDSKGNPCASPQHVLAALREGRGDAGIITADLWNHAKNQETDVALKLVWTSPPFSHCVFTAPATFDKALAARFTQLMTAMDPEDAATAEVMRLEGTRKWLPGSQDGFKSLIEALGKQ
jgi:ABC-type phosphate/phosphonate transport system substrate-binding protein